MPRVQVGADVIEFPDGMTADQINAAAAAHFKSQSSPAAPVEEPRSVAGFLGNAVTSTGKLIKDTVTGAMDTANFVGKLQVGDIETLKSLTKAPELVKGMIEHYKGKYGSAEDIQRTLYEDPASVAADVSMLLGGVSGGARAAGLTRVARVADAVNPARVVAPVARGAGKAGKFAGSVAKEALTTYTKESPSLAAHVVRAAKERFSPTSAAAAESTLVPPVVEAPPSRLQRLVRGDMPTEELFPAREIPPEPPAPPVEPKRAPATRAERTPQPPMTRAEKVDGSKMAGQYRQQNVQKTADPAYQNPRKTTTQPEVDNPPEPTSIEGPKREVAPPSPRPEPKIKADATTPNMLVFEGEYTPALVRLGRIYVNKNGQRIQVKVRGSEAIPVTPADVAPPPPPAPGKGVETINEARQRVAGKQTEAKQNIYEVAGREKKATAYTDWLKSNATPEIVDLIKQNKWSVVAAKAGMEKPSPSTIQRILEKFAGAEAK